MERIGLAPGSQIGGYTVVAPLGSGGMGTVYRAVDDGGTAVALKLLHPQIGADAEGRERLRREVVALQRLRHPAVASVLDAEADSTEAFIVTELVPGENLEEHVRAHGPLEPQDLHELAAGLVDALAAVHAAGVVHRDLKPTNVLVTDDGPVLIDFGIAQAAGDDWPQVTSTGLVVGTPGYLAPELLDGADPSPATDLWGLAAVVAFAATGRPPFGTRPVQAVLARAQAGDVDVDGLGPLTGDALRGALDPDPDARLHCDDLVAVLAVVAADGDPVDAPLEAAETVVYAVDDEDDDEDDDLLDEPDGADDPDDGSDDRDDDGRTEHGRRAPGATVAATAVLANPATPRTARALPAQDGRTRVVPTGDPTLVGTGYDDDLDNPDLDLDVDELDLEDDAVLPDGVDWIADDLDASEVVAEGSGYVRPPARRRWGSVLAAAALAVAAGALAPTITVVVVAVVMLAVRTFGTAVEAMHGRREQRGVRSSDVARTAAATPWYLVRSLVAMVPSLVVASCAALLAGGVVAWLVDNGTWTLGDLRPGDEVDGPVAAAVVAGVVALWLVVAWWGPLSGMTRTGARRALAVVAPGPVGVLAWVAVCVAAAVVLVVLVSNGAGIVWAPAPTPTIP